MGTAADDLRDQEEERYEDHLMGWCGLFCGCPYCERERRKKADTSLDKESQ